MPPEWCYWPEFTFLVSSEMLQVEVGPRRVEPLILVVPTVYQWMPFGPIKLFAWRAQLISLAANCSALDDKFMRPVGASKPILAGQRRAFN